MNRILRSSILAVFLLISSASRADDIEIITAYLRKIASEHHQNKDEAIPLVAITGSPGVGKTYFTKLMVDELKKKDVHVIALAQDDFNLSGVERKKIGTEWDIRHFKYVELHNFLEKVTAGSKQLEKPTYNQSKAEVGREKLDLTDVDLILFEGIYTLGTKAPLDFGLFCDGGIYVDADKEHITEWKWQREQKKSLPRSAEQFIKHMEVMFYELDTNIAYTKDKATFVLYKDADHSYHLENKNKQEVLE